MIKYAKIINETTGQVDVGLGTNAEFYQSIGMTLQDVEQSDVDSLWYLIEKCPHKSEEEKLQEAKNAKYAENDEKAESARTSKTFTLTLQEKQCEFDTKAQTQTDLLTAFAVCSQGSTYDGWVCNNGVVIDLTLSDVTTISVKFKELSNVYPHWNYYKSLIDNATTKAEVDAIVIDYDVELTTEDETVEETEGTEVLDEDN